LLRIAQRQRPQQERIHNAEYGYVGANAQSQDEHCDGRETEIAAQGAGGEAQILQQHIHPRQAPRLALLFLSLSHSAETDQRLAPGLFLRHAAPHVLVHCEFEMRCNLSVQFCVPALPVKEGPDSLQAFAQSAHYNSPSVGKANTRPITRVNRCQCAASSANCLRPLLVIE